MFVPSQVSRRLVNRSRGSIQEPKMATDQTVVHIGENSPEKIAYTLFHDVLSAEGAYNGQRVDRAYILDTYAECLKAAKGHRVPKER